MKEIKVLKSLYAKEAILYTINLYLEEKDFSIDEDEKNFIINLENLDDADFLLIKQELTFNSLRFEIADKNKDFSICSKYLQLKGLSRNEMSKCKERVQEHFRCTVRVQQLMLSGKRSSPQILTWWLQTLIDFQELGRIPCKTTNSQVRNRQPTRTLI